MKIASVAIKARLRDQLLESERVRKQCLPFEKLDVESFPKRWKALPERAPLRKECKGLPCGGFSLSAISYRSRHDVGQTCRVAAN